MKNLRKKIVWYFIICSFLLQCTISAVQSCFEELIMPVFEKLVETNAEEDISGGALTSIVGFFVIVIILFVIAAFIFYKLVKKAVKKESDIRMEEQRLMYASLAHDLKTPLTSVIGFSSSLIDKKIPDDKKDEVVHTVHDKAVQMNALLESMLSYSKLNSESYQLKKEKIDFCKFVRNLTASLYADFESHNITVEVDIPETELIINADVMELSRAVGNLLANVWIHNPEGTLVLIKVSESKKYVSLCIADTGNTIDPKNSESLFTPFVSGNEARTSGKSSGLGLAISKAVVERHGGKLYIDFNMENFTKAFIVEVPKCKEK